ncbi:hypothetical protein KC343_g132 [Hortaea werneckii]|nr:hypothetical protein KC352_g1242 [Hortaea werneckii]KAI7573131.1 hypothetical protein KC317_g152 [Hortaea werneckii]KAI7628527.1 hypothetical protein KC346_g128 [Hortaea werneckii]KAI7638358.1 hypothetical protein KC343_g132 [Hortaea werneckii]KAI7683987.1 hypothetical protein KC319_g159 [Hortaea werneckii]
MVTAPQIPDFLSKDFDPDKWVNEQRRDVVEALASGVKGSFGVTDLLKPSIHGKDPAADDFSSRMDSMQYAQNIARSDLMDKDVKIAILRKALNNLHCFAEDTAADFTAVQITLRKHAQASYAMHTIQRYLENLRSQMNADDVAAIHQKNLQQAEVRIQLEGYTLAFEGSQEWKLRAAYDFFALLAAGKLEYGFDKTFLSDEDDAWRAGALYCERRGGCRGMSRLACLMLKGE